MKKILVIEDTESLRLGIVQALECLNFEAIEADNGRAGIQLAKMHLPDLIVCDIMMPELDGYEVYSALRQDQETIAIPFIFLTAKADKSDIRKGMNLGADDYLTKPFTTAELEEAIAARLKKQSAIIDPYISEMKQVTEQLGELAYRDPLTKLANRILLQHKLQKAIMEAKRDQKNLAVLCVNLHRFKTINSTFGHSTGDLLLQTVAERLTQCIGQQNIAARVNADVFCLILVDSPNKQAVEEYAQRILHCLSEPYHLNDHQISMQASIGITLYPEDNSNLGKLLSHAEMSMGYAKQSCSSGYQFYQAEMGALSEQRNLLEKCLTHALENSEFQVYYQPQINLITGRIIGAEALLRWHHPDLGNVSPATFIPIAEETDLIVKIGEWVLTTVCTQAKLWQHFTPLSLRIAVNLSARQFQQQNLVETITQTLNQAQLDPNCLELELTETSLMGNVESAIVTLQKLKAMGIKISIDDFGTGYSSLNYLKRLPLDILKIDRSFIHDIFHDPQDAVIVTTIIAMAQNLKLRVIAEGVETEEQLDFLRNQGCHAMQGYLFSPAIPAEQFEALLVEDRRL